MNKYSNYNINKLNLKENIINTLKENNINTLEDLWVLKRNNLKELGFTNDEIKLIIIELQLMGFDLNKRKYS